jgi:hypothetical protein
MAKQVGEIKIRGTVAGITFYRMEGQYYARRKSSLSGERMKRDKRFSRTMQSANRLGRGSQLASRVYRALPKDEQVYALFCTLKRTAIRALKEGRGEVEALELLEALIGTKDKGQSTRGREAARCMLYAVRRGEAKAKQRHHITKQPFGWYKKAYNRHTTVFTSAIGALDPVVKTIPAA